jgi:hypothetical protein
MILRALHYEQQEHPTTLQSIIGGTDGHVVELLANGSKIARELANALQYRRFFKRVFEAKVWEICDLKPNMDYSKVLADYGPSFSKANTEFKSWGKLLEFEESCLPSEHNKGSVLVDCPKLKLPSPPTPDSYTPIKFRDGRDKSIVEVSPIVHAVEMEGESFATSILCAAAHNVDKTTFESNVRRGFKEKFGIVIR